VEAIGAHHARPGAGPLAALVAAGDAATYAAGMGEPGNGASVACPDLGNALVLTQEQWDGTVQELQTRLDRINDMLAASL